MKPIIFITLLTLIAGITGCNSGSSITRATGIAYEIIVVADNAIWDGAAGFAVKEDLTSPVPYLPQAESSMKITYVRPDLFDGIFKYVRNILIVHVDRNMYTKVSMPKESDKWARGQSVVYLNAPDEDAINAFLAENPRILVNHYTKEEMKRTRDFLYKTYSPVVMEKVKNRFGITLNAPSDITSFKDSTDCLWFSNNAVTGRMDLLIYSFPFVDKNTFTLDYLVAKRDSFTKKMLPGAFPGSYMSTEKRVVDYSAITLRGKYCGVLRGLWRMEGGDMMGGPFVSYARVDEKNQRVIVTEGFVYEPQKEKKNYIRRLEAALLTTRFADEQASEQAENTEEVVVVKNE
ncbi:MAG: DUF4837 family protein [Tannerella sp.]|jgi:hypothetical protein|nr:DUF4837 family protein [Tannerella sp.]